MQSESRQRFASQFDYDDQQGSTAASDNTRFVPQLNEMTGGFDEYNYQFERGVYLGAQHQAGLFPSFPSSGLMDFNDIPRDTKIGFDMEGASAFAAPGAHDSNFPAGFLDDMIDPDELEQPYTQDFGIDGGRWINGLPPTPAFAQPDGQMVYAYSQTAQPGNPTYHQLDLGVGATTPWLSAPFGANQWSAPKAVDQPMADALHAWDASFSATTTPIPTTQTGELGATYASIPAGAGCSCTPIPESTEPSLDPLFRKRDGRFDCTIASCNRSFGRHTDLNRHQNAFHFLPTAYWCSKAGCDRGVGGRAFPRKYKRNEHERKVHGTTIHGNH